MSLETMPAATLKFDAEHWPNSSVSVGTGWGTQLMEDARQAIAAFAADEGTPDELREAANYVWSAVEQTSAGVLMPFGRDLLDHGRAYDRSPTKWWLDIVRKKEAVDEIPKTVGVLLTRVVTERVPGIDSSFVPSRKRGAKYDIHTEAYVWITPEFRRQGIAGNALERTSRKVSNGVIRAAFDIDPDNVAAIKLSERFAQPTTEQVVA